MEFQPKKKGKSLIINITSLIDVMFLLLIFFMVSSTFKSQPAINLVLPRSATAEQTPTSPSVLYLTDDGTIYLDDRQLTEDELQVALQQLQAATAEDRIVLRADMQATHGRVVGLIDLVKKSGFTRISLSARQVADTPR